MPVDELIAPVAYSWWVTPLGLLLMAAAVTWVVWVLRTKRFAPATGAPPAAPDLPAVHARRNDRFATIRPVYLARIDEVERRFRAGELDTRGLHLSLSEVVRDFATVRVGVDARRMTLAELRAVGGAKRLVSLIDSYYRPSFSRRGSISADPVRALEGARKVVRQW